MPALESTSSQRLDRVLDLSFVSRFLQKAYLFGLGRPSVDGPLAARIILLGYLYNLFEVQHAHKMILGNQLPQGSQLNRAGLRFPFAHHRYASMAAEAVGH